MQSQHTFEGHSGRIFSLALCTLNDGRKLAASASHDRTVRIWCLNTFQHVRTIEYTDFVWRVFIVFCPRPCVVAFISTEDKIQVSDLNTGETINVFYGRLVFSGSIPSFKQPIILASIGEEDITFLDVNNGEKLQTIRGGFDKVFRAVVSTVSNNNPVLAFTTWNAPNRRSTIQTFDMVEANVPHASETAEREYNRNKMQILFEGDSRDGVTSLIIMLNASNPLICSGHYDFKVRLWSLETKQLLRILEGHTDYVGSVAPWKGGEPLVISGSSDGTVKVWNTQTGAIIASCEGHMRDVWAVTVTPSHKPLIVSASFDRTIRVWDINQTICDLKWQRRKNFCFFLHCCGYCEARSDRWSQRSDQLVKLPGNVSSSSQAFKVDGHGTVFRLSDIARNDIAKSDDGSADRKESADRIADEVQNKYESCKLIQESFIIIDDQLIPMADELEEHRKAVIAHVLQSNALCRIIASYL